MPEARWQRTSWAQDAHGPDRARAPRTTAFPPIRQSGLERRETLGPPVAGSRSPNFAATRASEPETLAERVNVDATCGRSRSDASRALFLGALARRKLEAPPDARHERRQGETVREGTRNSKRAPRASVCKFRLAGSRHDRRRSRNHARRALTGRRVGLLRLAGKRGAGDGVSPRASDGPETGSGVPASDHEGVRGRSFSGQRSSTIKRPRRVQHPRR